MNTLRAVQGVLEDCGAETEIACSFQDAVMRVFRHDFDLIIADHRPPAFDGVRIMNFIKQHRPECVNQVCFIVADNVSAEDISALTQSGAVPWSSYATRLMSADNKREDPVESAEEREQS